MHANLQWYPRQELTGDPRQGLTADPGQGLTEDPRWGLISLHAYKSLNLKTIINRIMRIYKEVILV